MLKNWFQKGIQTFSSDKNCVNRDGYIRRAPIVALLVFSMFVVEMGALLRNSQVSVSANEVVAKYEEEAMVRVSKNTIVMGDIYDSKGVPLLSYETPLSQDHGTYADNYIYSSVIGYCQMGNKGGLAGKYQPLLIMTSDSEDTKGYSMYLTLEHELQKKVYEELSSCIGSDGRGSMVVLDADTGKILSMVSMPVYDASNISEEAKWMNDEEKSNGVWYPLATKGMIAPGSTFKLLSAIALIESGREDFTTADDTSYQGSGYVINNYSSYRSSPNPIGYRGALKKSSNVFFVKALVQEEDTRERITEIASRLYLGTPLNLDFGVVTSTFTYTDDIWEQVLQKTYFNEERELATTLFGQSEVRMSSLQGAMMAAGFINHGVIMTPYMIESVRDSRGNEQNLSKIMEHFNEKMVSEKDTALSVLTDPSTAEKILDAMKYAATEQYHFSPDLGVAAKSGTSETGNTGNAGNNSWMVSCAEINGHCYAIAINWANAAAGTQGKDMKVPVENVFRYLKNQQ